MAVDAASASGRVSQAIEAVIRGIGINPAPSSIVRRKKMVIQDGDGTRIIIIEVANDEQYEPISNGTQDGYLLWECTRSCGVALGYASGGRVSDNPDLRTARGQIEDAMTMGGLQRAGLVGTFCSANDVVPSGRMVFDLASSPGTDWSVVLFAVKTLEEKRYGI
jgi:hypothetical protein